MTKSLDALRLDLLGIIRAAVGACDGRRLVARALAGDGLADRPVRVVAAGKAAPAMAEGAMAVLGDRVRAGVVIADDAGQTPAALEFIKGGHPVPTAESERAGRRALEIAAAGAPSEALLVLLSGGASALMAVPAAGVTLADKQRATERLLRAGAEIHALNTVRKHLSAIKGGQLAVQSATAWRTLAISDVIGDDLSAIASGPTVADPSTFADALTAIRQLGGAGAEQEFPARVMARLSRGAAGELPDTPKPGDPRLSRGEAAVIGGRHDAMRGAAAAAVNRGYRIWCLEDAITGEARTAAAAHFDRIRGAVKARPLPLCIISSGETTVTVSGGGRGGRNQEFALALVDRLPRLGARAVLGSVGTDGVDGPTDAAGAIVDSDSAIRAERAGVVPGPFLHDNNAYAFFAALGDLIHLGRTGTNVGDLQLILLA